jgi:hypothetical protein
MEKNGNYYVDSHGLFRIWQKILSTISGSGGATSVTDITSQAVVDPSWNVASKNVLQYGKLVQVNLTATAIDSASRIILTGLPTSAANTAGISYIYGTVRGISDVWAFATNHRGTGVVGLLGMSSIMPGKTFDISITYLCD